MPHPLVKWVWHTESLHTCDFGDWVLRSSYYKADCILFTEFVVCFCLLFAYFFFFFLHSGFKYFFREKVCVSGGGRTKTAQAISFWYLEMHECDC